MLKKQINKKGEKSAVEIVILNNSLETVRDIEIKLLGSTELDLEETTKKFDAIKPKEIVYFRTQVQSTETGEFELDCELNFEGQETNCKTTTILFEEETIDQKLIIGIFMVIIGLGIYAYLYLR